MILLLLLLSLHAYHKEGKMSQKCRINRNDERKNNRERKSRNCITLECCLVFNGILTLHSTMKFVTNSGWAFLWRRNSSRTYSLPNTRNSVGRLWCKRRIVLYNLKTVERCWRPKILSYIDDKHSFLFRNKFWKKKLVCVCVCVCFFSHFSIFSLPIQVNRTTARKKKKNAKEENEVCVCLIKSTVQCVYMEKIKTWGIINRDPLQSNYKSVSWQCWRSVFKRWI